MVWKKEECMKVSRRERTLKNGDRIVSFLASVKTDSGKWSVRQLGSITNPTKRAEAEARRQAELALTELKATTRPTKRGRAVVGEEFKGTFAELCEHFLAAGVIDKLKGFQQEHSLTTRIMQSEFAGRGAARITPQDLHEHLQQYANVSTRHKRYNAIRRVFLWAIDRELLRANPCDHRLAKVRSVSPSHAVGKRRALSIEEQQCLLANIDPYYRPIVEMALFMGLRRGSIFALLKSWVDLKGRKIWIKGSHAHAGTKDGGEWELPIPKQLVPTIEAALKTRGAALFPNRDGARRNQYEKVPEAIRAALEAGGFDSTGVDLHTLRHTFATRLVSSGVPLAHAQRLLLHRTPQMTLLIYSHLSTDELAKSLEGVNYGDVPTTTGSGPGSSVGPAEYGLN
jgi:integrase